MAEKDILSDAREAIWDVLDALLTGYTLLDEADANRLNWVKFIQGGYTGLSAPFVVVNWDRTADEPGMGITNRVWRMPFRVILVDDADRNAADRDIYFTSKLMEIEQAIRGASGTAYLVKDVGTIDTGSLSPANRTIIEQNLPYHAAELSFVVRVGWSP